MNYIWLYWFIILAHCKVTNSIILARSMRSCSIFCIPAVHTVSYPFTIILNDFNWQVIDGLRCFMDLNVTDKIYSIRDAISSNPQITIFTDPSDKNVATMARNLLHGRITKLSVNDSVSSRSAFITQHVHLCPLEKQKTLKVIACVSSQVIKCPYYLLYLS